jgi:hypothetical protein
MWHSAELHLSDEDLLAMNSHEDRANGKDQASLSVTIDNEGDGRRLAIRVAREHTVQQAVDELYERLGRAPSSEDRLRCAVNSEDVLFFATETAEDYLQHCPDLHWLFAGPAGGAAR